MWFKQNRKDSDVSKSVFNWFWLILVKDKQSTPSIVGVCSRSVTPDDDFGERTTECRWE